MNKSTLIGCGTCGYPLAPEERTTLVEVGGVMVKPTATHCTWTPDADPNAPGTFHSACGVAWTFTEGGPADNDVRFCMGCGCTVKEAAGK